jgi:hypothetical protein
MRVIRALQFTGAPTWCFHLRRVLVSMEENTGTLGKFVRIRCLAELGMGIAPLYQQCASRVPARVTSDWSERRSPYL